MSDRVAIVGLATLDYVLTTSHPLAGPGTVLADIVSAEWPRAGGAPLYAARSLRAAGCTAWPIVSVGDDENGTAYKAACRMADISVDGVAEIAGSKTPCCVLIYHDDGPYTCLLDLGTAAGSASRSGSALTVAQAKLVGAADMIVVAAADPQMVFEVIGQISDAQRLAWIAKDDPNCFPAAVCESLVQRADIVFCNTAEMPLIEPFLASSKSRMILFETRGAEGVRILAAGLDQCVEATPVEIVDATGAGDTFAGAVLATLLNGETSPITAAKRGVDLVRKFLLTRQIAALR